MGAGTLATNVNAGKLSLEAGQVRRYLDWLYLHLSIHF